MNKPKKSWRPIVLGLLAVFFVIGMYTAYYIFLYVGYVTSVDASGNLTGVRSGTFGDAFGALNALFSGLAFSGVLVTLLLQRKDLEDGKLQSAKQQTESQFYNMLNLQQQVIQGFDLHVKKYDFQYTLEGRDCFRDWYRKLLSAYKESNPSDDESFRAGYAYQLILQAHQGDLGLYFRSLYSVFRFIELADHADKIHLGRVVRSLLSDYELVFLYYNCLSHKGMNFQIYANNHALFDNLDIKLLLSPDHVVYMDSESFGSNVEALCAIESFNFR